MGFFDSFTQGVGSFFGGLADFTTDIIGAGLQIAPTVIPILQSTGVIPAIPTQGNFGPFLTQGNIPGGQMRTALPGGAPMQIPGPRINPFSRNQPGAAPVGAFPPAFGSGAVNAPFGVQSMAAFPSTRGGFQQAAFPALGPLALGALGGAVGAFTGQGSGLGLPFIDIVGQGGGATLGALTSPFRATMAGARAQPFINANPATGALTWFKPAGKPILWSGDLTACKRVGRIARRARRVKR